MKTLYRCEHCKEYFTKEEEIYSIFNLKLEKHEEKNAAPTLHWRWIFTPSDKTYSVAFFFHKECFLTIAGERYISPAYPVPENE